MPDTAPIVHFIERRSSERTVCNILNDSTPPGWPTTTEDPGRVTCFACRRSPEFSTAQQGVGAPTPLPQRQTPKLLRDIIAEDPALSETAAKAWLSQCRNHRGMYTIQEVIHHGDYISERIVEVYDVNETTVDAVLQSSAYCYGSWAHAEPPYTGHRKAALATLVQDLRHGRENRSIGWSTFRLIPNK
jgi:hypothetical protein